MIKYGIYDSVYWSRIYMYHIQLHNVVLQHS